MQVLHAYMDVGGRALPGASAEEQKPAFGPALLPAVLGGIQGVI